MSRKSEKKVLKSLDERNIEGFIELVVPDSSIIEEPGDDLVTIDKLDEVVSAMNRQTEARLLFD